MSLPSRSLCLAALMAAAVVPLRATIVVEAIEATLGADEAGLRVGDELLDWRSEKDSDRGGSFDSWLDLERLEYGESGLGPVEVALNRKGTALRLVLPARYWGIEARPELTPEMLAALADALGRAREEPEQAALRVRELVAGKGLEIRSWALARLAAALETGGSPDTSAAAWAEAAAGVPAPLVGIVHWKAGGSLMRSSRLDLAQAALERALAIWEREEPAGLWSAAIEIDRGDLEGLRFDLASARRHYQRSYEIRRKLAPGSWLLAVSVRALGVAAGRQNDLATAEALFQEALALRLALGGSGEGEYNNLGIVSHLRGDYERAESYMRQALAIRRRESPGQAPLASILMNLGNTVSAGGDPAAAIAFYDEALAIFEEVEPGSQSIPRLLRNRAQARKEAGALDLAERDATDSLERFRGLGGSLPDEASALHELGEIARARGDLAAAERLLGEALEIRNRVLPDSSFVAYSAAALGETWRRRGDLGRAEELYRQAVEAIERQQQRIGGGSRGLVAFRDKFAGIYRAYVEVLLESGRSEDAFRIYERSRGQALRALLDQRDLDLTGDLPPELDAERRELAGRIESAYRAMSRLPAAAAAERRESRLEIERLHAARDALGARFRALSPRLAASQAPPPVDLARIRSGLDAGTLLLAYSLGEESSTLFVLGPRGPIEALPIDAGAAGIAAEVSAWSAAAQRARGGAQLEARTARLTARLLAPAAKRIAAARKLVIVPDGALHGLSFAALHDPAAAEPRYLVERLAVVHAVSASLYAGSKARGAGDASGVAAFGDPAYDESSVARFRRELGRLPASRREARVVGEIYGDRARVFVDHEATEAAARRELARAGIAHFACHALVDEQLPLDSALVLTPSEGDEGLLQAWEIVEAGDFAADLVVLSACETARGGERAGEGIVGLVRAFQIAGVTDVVASLWAVSDESTAELMRVFYGRLAAGDDRAEALRAAQLELLTGSYEVERDGKALRVEASAPRHWAPFVIVGRAD